MLGFGQIHCLEMSESTHRTLRVELGERSYPIYIGQDLLVNSGELLSSLDVFSSSKKRVVVVADENAAKPFLEPLKESLEGSGFVVDTIVLGSGEGLKSFTILEGLLDRLLSLKVERKSVLVALGGGVIGDITGFAASILRRGVPFIQIPTTLLSQVDSSVGGKTGINSIYGKNLIGSFYQPRAVLADTDTLKTLPLRELKAGYAEVVKYGAIGDLGFFKWLQDNGNKLLHKDVETLQYAVYKSCEAKAQIVARDEQESGVRALLNFGHTFGHAFEAELGYDGRLLHGEAVSIGMVMAMTFSAEYGLCPKQDVAEFKEHLVQTGLPTNIHDVSHAWKADILLAHMAQDKKVEDGALTFILSHGLGKAFIEKNVSKDQMRVFLDNQLE